MKPAEPQPIASAPRDGKVVFVGDQAGNIAQVFWRVPPPGHTVVRGGKERPATRDDGMWAYAIPEGETLIEQVDFEPTHWADNAKAFLPKEPA